MRIFDLMGLKETTDLYVVNNKDLVKTNLSEELHLSQDNMSMPVIIEKNRNFYDPGVKDETYYQVDDKNSYKIMEKCISSKPARAKTKTCPVCWKTFPSHLNRHLLIHTGNPKHECQICSQIHHKMSIRKTSGNKFGRKVV